MSLEFRDPPGRGSEKWQMIADELRDNPGKWAYLGVCHQSNASNIRCGVLVAFRPRGDFDACIRTRGEGPSKVDVYARYVGEG